MAELYLFNKPFNVLSQFTDNNGRSTLADFINTPDIYPAGRLDYDSEGLLILTSCGELQARIADPKHKLPKTYWVQVEGDIDDKALNKLEYGVLLKDGLTRPAKIKRINEPDIWPRIPPIRYRKNDTTSWIELTLTEGRNRQVRRMTAEAGFPTLRLIRYSIGPWSVKDLEQGTYIKQEVHLPKRTDNDKNLKKTQNKAYKFNPKSNIIRK
tara:strand:- start:1885 stop:2517 length:633 start_codon:yes stop_codon:yes gene_type:complete